jgi:DNA repair ATPase RecN
MSQQSDTATASGLSKIEVLACLGKLGRLRGQCQAHIESTEEAQQLRDSLLEEQQAITAKVAQLNEMRVYTKKCMKVCGDYLAERRMIANTDLKLAIKSASSVVAGCPPLKYVVKENSAVVLAGPEDRASPVDLIEGGAMRTSISFFIRQATLQNTVYLPFILLDEAFSVMSADTSEAVSHLLKEVSRNFQLIVIEQKPEVTSAGVDACFRIVKESGKSTAVRVS